ncbi:MAG TPA: sialate O-acetylesterase [Bryobacteraceae bacterium]|jgi:sialate O-acetylesterase
MLCRILFALGCLALPLAAEVKLPAIISDHMLIQQQMPVRIWGKAAAGEKISVEMNGQRASAVADPSGAWEAFLPPMQAGGPFDMRIRGANDLVVHDVLIGEVWVGSGQSNMELPMTRIKDSEAEIAAANYPQIRLFTVKKKVSDMPLDDVTGEWSSCTPESARNFSAVGYFFSRYIHQNRHVPVGFIHSSWGGTPAQSWTAHPVMESDPRLKPILEDWDKTLAKYPAASERYEKQLADFKAAAAAAKADGKPAPTAPRPPAGPGHPNTPAGLWNAMIAPITPYSIRGALWYQGEANANPAQAFAYRYLFQSMIEDWRREWAEGDFPFLFVQLASFQSNGSWPVLRESQTDTLQLRNTGMAVIDDIGESKNIHPLNKQDVGKRLALVAQAIAYGEKIEYSGPMYRQMTREGNSLRLYFEHTGSGLDARGGGNLLGFEIAGKDGNFVSANARIEGQTVVVACDQISDPAKVRYAWADDPQATLENREGLQASPFRADLK